MFSSIRGMFCAFPARCSSMHARATRGRVRPIALTGILFFVVSVRADSPDQRRTLTDATTATVEQAIRSDAAATSSGEVAGKAIENAHAALADAMDRVRAARESNDAGTVKLAEREYRIVARRVREADAMMKRIRNWLRESHAQLAEAEAAAKNVPGAETDRLAQRAAARVSKRAKSIEELLSRIQKPTRLLKQAWLVVTPVDLNPPTTTTTTIGTPASAADGDK